MKLSEVMTQTVERVPPETPLIDVARKMKEADVGAIPVYEGDRLIGMVTDRDIAIRAVAAGKDPSKCTAKEAMGEGVFYCFDDEPVKAAAEKMRKEKVRRLIVLNREKRLVGIVSLGDLAAHGDGAMAGRTLEGVASAPPVH
jgi:CBS domain-containing protein